MNRRDTSLKIAIAAITILATGSVIRAQDAPKDAIVIVGQRNPENIYHEFIWTVRNEGNEPIVSFVAPSYQGGGLVLPPKGWSGETTHATIGDRAQRETVEFRATTRSAGIRRGMEKIFVVRVYADLRWQPVQHTVAVGLADGSEILIPNILCPDPESALRHNVPLIGLSVIFGIFLIVQAVRKRKPQSETNADA